MASKEIKTALKQARDAIRAKDFKEALKNCKAVLKLDKTNYNALVFVGVAAEGLEQAEQALAAYKRAIEADPEQALAWQGLCGFYEKSGNPSYHNDLVEVYNKLITLFERDVSKKHELSVKLAQLYQSMHYSDKALELYRSLVDHTADPPVASTAVWTGLVALLGDTAQTAKPDERLLEAAYNHLVEEEGTSEEIWVKHIQALLRSAGSNPSKVGERCISMRKQFPSSFYPLTVLIQLELDALKDTGEVESDMESVVTELSSLDENSSHLALWKGYQALRTKDFRQAADQLKAGLSECSLLSGWVLLTQALLGMYDHKSAMKTLEKVLKLQKLPNNVYTGDPAQLKTLLSILKADVLVLKGTTESCTAAIDLCQKVLSANDNCWAASLCLVKAYMASGDTQKARQSLERLAGLDQAMTQIAHMEGQCLLLEGRVEEAHETLSAACDKQATSGQCWFWLGRVYWQMWEAGESSRGTSAGQALLQSAKLDPYFSPTFLYLGHYYGKLLGDSGKARRCYQKAYELDSSSPEAGCALVDALVAQEDHALAKSLLLSITAQASAGSAKWAWLRLGLQQVRDDEPTAAITSLQGALRADPTDNHVWECLGEAYLKRGSYTAAMKAFARGAELDPDSIYCNYQIASIKQLVGQYVEAVAEYEGILDKHTDYVPALKGAGESMVELAKEAINKFFHGRAVDHCQAALPHLTRAASLRPDLSCLWKLLGDACTILYPLPEDIVKVSVPAKLMDPEAQLTETKVLNRRDLITLGGRCYGMALKQQADCAGLWHDLGVSYFYQSQLDGTSGSQLASRAVQALQKAVTLAPTCHRHWTALGVVAASDEVDHPALAQHSFIKSTEVEQCNVVAWTNLGTLYLKHDKTKLAHEAFKVAQSLDPSFTASWVGQALIAERVGHEEAMDLFRHTTELGTEVEGSLGYAHWVCSTLREKGRLDQELYQYCIERMAAVPAAADALARYTDRMRDNAAAYNMHGLLLERLQLNQQAAEAFSKSLDILKGGNTEYLALCQANYARILGRLKRYDESVAAYNSLTVPLSVEDLSWKGLACYHTNNFKDSVIAYGEALKMCTEEGDRSNLESALGMVLFKAGDIEGAKAAFFRGFQCSSPSSHGIAALCALGLLQQDTQLANAALAELEKQEDSQVTAAHTAILKAHVADMQGDYSLARNALVSAIHQHPDNYLLWRHLATFLIQHPRGKSSVAAHCAKLQSLSAGGDAKAWTGVMCLSGLAGGLHSRTQSNNNGLRLAQKALHAYPDSLSNWCGLMGSMYGDYVMESSQDGVRTDKLHHAALGLATHIMAKVETELQHGERSQQASLQTFHLWCVQQYILLLLGGGRTDQATQFLQQATWLYESDPIMRALQAFLQKDFRAMKAATQDAKGVFPGQLLHVALAEEGLTKDLRKAINLHIKFANSTSSKISCLVELALLAYQQLQLPECDVNRWGTIFEEACDDTLDLQPDCPAIHLLKALTAVNSGDVRIARHHARIVLEGERSGSSGTLASLARRVLLYAFKQKNDTEGVQKLVESALEEKDQVFLDYYYSSLQQAEA